MTWEAKLATQALVTAGRYLYPQVAGTKGKVTVNIVGTMTDQSNRQSCPYCHKHHPGQGMDKYLGFPSFYLQPM